jgi:hypothetical protein
MPSPRPVITIEKEDRVIEAQCSSCGMVIDLGNVVGTPEEQQRKLAVAFASHLESRHTSLE